MEQTDKHQDKYQKMLAEIRATNVPLYNYAQTSSSLSDDTIDTIGFSPDGLCFWLLHGELPLSYGGPMSDEEKKNPHPIDYAGVINRAILSHYDKDAPLKAVLKNALFSVKDNPLAYKGRHGVSIAIARFAEKGDRRGVEWLLLGDCYITFSSHNSWITQRDNRLYTKGAAELDKRLDALLPGSCEDFREFVEVKRTLLRKRRAMRNYTLRNADPVDDAASYPADNPYYSLAVSDFLGDPDTYEKNIRNLVNHAYTGQYPIQSSLLTKDNPSRRWGSTGNMMSTRSAPNNSSDGRILLWSHSTLNTLYTLEGNPLPTGELRKLFDNVLIYQIATIEKKMQDTYGFSDAMAAVRGVWY